MTALARRLLLAPPVVMSIAAACDDSSIKSAPVDAGAEDSPAEITDASVSTDGPAMCNLGAHFGSPRCEACMSAKCCDKVTACAKDPSCAAMRSCALDCLL